MARNGRLQSAAFVLGAVFLACFTGKGAQAQAEQEQLDRTPVSCVLVNEIDRDLAISSRTILFFMNGGKMFYRNDMPGNCANLERGETRFTYNYNTQSVTLTRLCNADSITVERKTGLSCRLGQFLPITAAEAETLVNDPAAAPAVPQQATAATQPQTQITIVSELPPASPQCQASVSTGYFQANTLARVEGTIEIDGCAAATGRYTVAARIRDDSGETKTLEFAETFSRDDDQSLTFKGDYPIGENVELVSVRTRGVRCECAGQPAQ
jgi:hypothetical protein